MNKIDSLKEKILKYNSFSTYFVIFFITFFSFALTIFIVYEKYQTEITLIKTNYIENQKNMMKHQVNNLIKLIQTLREEKTKSVKKNLKLVNLDTSKILQKIPKKEYRLILSGIDKSHKFIYLTLSDLNANLIYSHLKDYNKTKRKKLIIKMLKNHINNIYFIHKTKKGKKITFQHIFKHYLLTTCTYQSIIDKSVKHKVIQIIYNVRFGPKNNGYISVAQILNYKGGKHFAKVIALPVNPSMVGKLLNDDKRDAKGKLYRKEYLKIANTTGEGFVSYWFYKYSTKIIRPKISYIKLYKPWNWLIFTSVFLDDINNVLHKKEEMFKKEIRNLIILYIILLSTVLLITNFIIKKENGIIKDLVNNFENKITEKNKELENLNKNLQSEVEKKTDELTKKMFSDNLTNLPNREKLLNDLNEKYIAIININDFKEINDFFGIDEGDRLIKEFGNFLNSIKETYKLSADEYAIIDNTPAKLRHISSKIIEKLKNTKFKIGKEKISINISIGIGKTLAEADTALKYAKQRKKQIIVYNKKLPILKEYEENIKWKNIINKAIESDNVIPFVQPIIDNKTKNPVKYECLMRIKDGDKIYTPFFFLETAKKTFQYETLQKIIIEKSFQKFSNLPYSFSINVSLRDLKNEQFIKYLIKKIKQYNTAEKLTIELLEDEELIYDKKINEILFELSNLGIKIAIDDFGSGYSNFVYLKNLPIDTIKIDGTLVKDILKDEKLKKLLKKIVEIADEFDFETVAEFVENEEIYTELIKLNVKYSQGYYFSKPFNIKELK